MDGEVVVVVSLVQHHFAGAADGGEAPAEGLVDALDAVLQMRQPLLLRAGRPRSGLSQESQQKPFGLAECIRGPNALVGTCTCRADAAVSKLFISCSV